MQTTGIRQHRTKRKKQQKTRKNGSRKAFTLKHELLKISVNLQTAFAEEPRLAEGKWLQEQLKVVKLRYVPSRNTNADCFEGRGTIFSASKNMY
jgi:hypothetical protein